MPPKRAGEYEVGYGKPPRHTRFAKGQSGNPRGRSPGARNLKTLVNWTLDQLVIVTENGTRRKVSKGEAMVTQIANRAASGDLRATKIVLDFLRDSERQSEPAPPETGDLGEADNKVLEGLKTRFAKAHN